MFFPQLLPELHFLWLPLSVFIDIVEIAPTSRNYHYLIPATLGQRLRQRNGRDKEIVCG